MQEVLPPDAGNRVAVDPVRWYQDMERKPLHRGVVASIFRLVRNTYRIARLSGIDRFHSGVEAMNCPYFRKSKITVSAGPDMVPSYSLPVEDWYFEPGQNDT